MCYFQARNCISNEPWILPCMTMLTTCSVHCIIITMYIQVPEALALVLTSDNVGMSSVFGPVVVSELITVVTGIYKSGIDSA